MGMMDRSAAMMRPWLLLLLLLARDGDWHSRAQPVSEGLSANDCISFLQQADTDSSGGVSVRGEYGQLIQLLGRRKCYTSTGSANGPQTILFLSVVCNTISSTDCSYDAEIPVDMPDAEMREVCRKVDSLVISDCDGKAPPTLFPTFAPSPQPTFADEPIARGLTLNNCRSDLTLSDFDNDNRLNLDEYTSFLELMGQRVCFTPDQNFEVALNGTFSEFSCLSNSPCAGADSIDLRAFAGFQDLRDFCAGSYILALNGAQCPIGSPQPTTPQPTLAPSEAPSVSLQPTGIADPLGARIAPPSSAASGVRLPSPWIWVLTLSLGVCLALLPAR